MKISGVSILVCGVLISQVGAASAAMVTTSISSLIGIRYDDAIFNFNGSLGGSNDYTLEFAYKQPALLSKTSSATAQFFIDYLNAGQPSRPLALQAASLSAVKMSLSPMTKDDLVVAYATVSGPSLQPTTSILYLEQLGSVVVEPQSYPNVFIASETSLTVDVLVFNYVFSLMDSELSRFTFSFTAFDVPPFPTGIPAGSTVPEPFSAVLALTGLGLMGVRRRRTPA